jgi:hypothetical protein
MPQEYLARFERHTGCTKLPAAGVLQVVNAGAPESWMGRPAEFVLFRIEQLTAGGRP